MDISEKIKTIPLNSGVYLMKDAAGKIIYVGKAVSLRQRVQSYFRKPTSLPAKTDFLVAEIKDIDCVETASEAEALILEASLIKKYDPKYNVELKDDKSYPLIEITNEPFPRISVVRLAPPKAELAHHPEQRRRVTRPRVKTKGAKYYGPYVNAKLIREALTLVRKVFPFRTCDPFPNKECLDYHLGLCDAPCIQNITKKEYARNIRNVCLILEGKKDIVYNSLREGMDVLAKTHEFEKAAKVRDQLRAIGALYSGTKDINYYKEAEQLQRILNLPRRPERIEAFDISNIMGHQAVGSMVSFLNGKADKNNYRRFRIKQVEGIDDFKMIAEIVQRRYRRLKKEGLAFPDLIVIDGGKGQLSAACRQLELLEVQIPIISLAKREEEIFLPNKRNSVKLPLASLALKLLQRIRDEAHRFAIAYHRNLRGKKALETK